MAASALALGTLSARASAMAPASAELVPGSVLPLAALTAMTIFLPMRALFLALMASDLPLRAAFLAARRPMTITARRRCAVPARPGAAGTQPTAAASSRAQHARRSMVVLVVVVVVGVGSVGSGEGASRACSSPALKIANPNPAARGPSCQRCLLVYIPPARGRRSVCTTMGRGTAAAALAASGRGLALLSGFDEARRRRRQRGAASAD